MTNLEITDFTQIILGLFIIAHGLIHLIFLLYSYDEKKATYMGWSGRSWLLDKFLPSNYTTYLGKATWVLIMILFTASGLSVLNLIILNEYSALLITISSAIATLAFIVYYNGLSPTPFHWILGVVINLCLITYVIFFPNDALLLLILLGLIILYGMLFHSRVLSKVAKPQS